MREYLKIQLNIIDIEAFKNLKEKYNSFEFCIHTPIQENEIYEARIRDEADNQFLLEVDSFSQIGTQIPLSQMDKGSIIHIMDSSRRKTQKKIAEGIVQERIFRAAESTDKTIAEIIPLTSSNSTIEPLNLSFSENAFRWIQLGESIKGMDSKWFIFYKNDFLHFIRSWTAIEVFKLKIYKSEGGYMTKEVQVHQETAYNQIELLETMLTNMAKVGDKVFDK